MAFRKKYKNIISHKPDLLFIQECEHSNYFSNTFYSDIYGLVITIIQAGGYLHYNNYII